MIEGEPRAGGVDQRPGRRADRAGRRRRGDGRLRPPVPVAGVYRDLAGHDGRRLLVLERRRSCSTCGAGLWSCRRRCVLADRATFADVMDGLDGAGCRSAGRRGCAADLTVAERRRARARAGLPRSDAPTSCVVRGGHPASPASRRGRIAAPTGTRPTSSQRFFRSPLPFVDDARSRAIQTRSAAASGRSPRSPPSPASGWWPPPRRCGSTAAGARCSSSRCGACRRSGSACKAVLELALAARRRGGRRPGSRRRAGALARPVVGRSSPGRSARPWPAPPRAGRRRRRRRGRRRRRVRPGASRRAAVAVRSPRCRGSWCSSSAHRRLLPPARRVGRARRPGRRRQPGRRARPAVPGAVPADRGGRRSAGCSPSSCGPLRAISRSWPTALYLGVRRVAAHRVAVLGLVAASAVAVGVLVYAATMDRSLARDARRQGHDVRRQRHRRRHRRRPGAASRRSPTAPRSCRSSAAGSTSASAQERPVHRHRPRDVRGRRVLGPTRSPTTSLDDICDRLATPPTADACPRSWSGLDLDGSDDGGHRRGPTGTTGSRSSRSPTSTPSRA